MNVDQERRRIQREAMDAAGFERADSLNRVIGCLFCSAAGVILAIVLVGYWATH